MARVRSAYMPAERAPVSRVRMTFQACGTKLVAVARAANEPTRVVASKAGSLRQELVNPWRRRGFPPPPAILHGSPRLGPAGHGRLSPSMTPRAVPTNTNPATPAVDHEPDAPVELEGARCRGYGSDRGETTLIMAGDYGAQVMRA